MFVFASFVPGAYWLKNGCLRSMAAGYHGATWRRAELAREARFGPGARLGVDPEQPGSALCSDRAQLRASLPAGRA
ncbi:MAG: hypothetical protein ACRDN6_15465 [Gaiellaceae bacterium]